jgi:predicted ATP-grasp superfamily ATP-dependent carboligase
VPPFSTLLIDFSGQTQILLAVLRSLARVGDVSLHLLVDQKRHPVRLSRHVSSCTTGGYRAPDQERVKQIRDLVRAKSIDILLPSGQDAVSFLGRNSKQLQTVCSVSPVPDVEACQTAADKWLLMRMLTEEGIPCPRTIPVDDRTELEDEIRELSFPVLLKPAQGVGGHGILKCTSPDDVLRHLESLTGSPHRYLLQEFIQGYDIDCSVLCKDGIVLAHTVQRGILPGTEEYAAPAGIRLIKEQQVLDTVLPLLSLLRWSGVAHIDLRYDPRERNFKILEINARYWRSLLGSVYAGVNFPYLACLTGLGIAFPRPEYQEIQFLHEHRVAVKRLIQQLGGRVSPTFRLQETSLSSALSDPLPDLHLLTHKEVPGRG